MHFGFVSRLSFVVSMAIAAASAASASAATPLVADAIDKFIRPAYASLADVSTTLATDVGALCTKPGDATLDIARRDFITTVQAWSIVEPIRFGPITEGNRLERFLFWPDRKGTGLKQVQVALAQKDLSVTDPASLAGKSVAMQGMGALEYVLFGTGAESLSSPGEPHRCAYASAIAVNLNTIAGKVSDEWADPNGFASVLANPGPDNPLYRNNTEAVTELFNVIVHGLELVRDVRINGFLADEAADDRPRQAIYWRSQGTVTSIAGNLNGLKTLFDTIDFAPHLTPDMAWIPDSIRFEFKNAELALRDIHGPIAETLADPQRRSKLAYTRLVTSSLSELFGVRLAGALGLSAGFSSLDGD